MARRRFIAGAASALALGLSAKKVRAAEPADRGAAIKCIDVHHHFIPPQYLKEGPPSVNFSRAGDWMPEKALEQMDLDGVEKAVLSFASPYLWFPGVEPGRRLARLCNDYCAQMVREHPTRFGTFAGLPALDDTEGCFHEIEYAFGTLHTDGIAVMTNYGEKWLGDPTFDPVFEELNRREAVVFVHPAIPSCCGKLTQRVPASYVELPFDTARAMTNLWFTGALTRWSKIKFILSHGGGALPMVADRVDKFGRPGLDAGAPPLHDAMAQFKKLYFDTANAASPPALAAMRNLTDPNHILFGTDYPYVPIMRGRDYLQRAGLSEKELLGIERDNALAILPSLIQTSSRN